MLKLSWVIEHEINFENTMNLFKVQLTDAIIYYQSKNEIINEKIFNTCSTIKNKSVKLNSKILKYNRKKLDYFNSKLKILRRSNNNINNHANTFTNSKLYSLLTNINKNFYTLTNFWNSLVLNLCKSISGNHENCWNGTSLSKLVTIIESLNLEFYSCIFRVCNLSVYLSIYGCSTSKTEHRRVLKISTQVGLRVLLC